MGTYNISRSAADVERRKVGGIAQWAVKLNRRERGREQRSACVALCIASGDLILTQVCMQVNTEY